MTVPPLMTTRIDWIWVNRRRNGSVEMEVEVEGGRRGEQREKHNLSIYLSMKNAN